MVDFQILVHITQINSYIRIVFKSVMLLSSQDTGISVRKRVIKILRDICIEQPTFPKITEMCVKMIRRVNDEEGIKVELKCIPWDFSYRCSGVSIFLTKKN